MQRQSTWCALTAGWILTAVVAGCSGGPGAKAGQPDPLTVMADKKANPSARLEAIDAAWASGGTPAERMATREALKTLVWQTGQLSTIRTRALEKLIEDQTPEGLADTRKFIRLRLPTEVDWDLIKMMGDSAAARGWTDVAPALVRSYSREVRSPDSERPERAALAAMFPSRDVVDTVYAVFAATPAKAGGPPVSATGVPAVDLDERTRRDAWALLARLDPDGSRRASLLAAGEETADDPAIADLRAAAKELHIVPLTAAEFDWLRSLRDAKEPRNARWWTETAAAVATLSQTQRSGLQMRHLEPVRWAAAHRATWLAADRSALLDELSSRLRGRKVFERTAEVGGDMGRPSGRLGEAEGKLVWGDVLTVLVLDEALKDAGLVASIFRQVEADRGDTSTEYGGIIESAENAGATPPASAASGGFVAVLYPPRPVQRVADNRFIASDEMVTSGARSVGLYHFHVQRAANAEYAGPGEGDTEFARTQGRACLVFTSIDKETLDVDYYQRGGAIVDLGTISRR